MKKELFSAYEYFGQSTLTMDVAQKMTRTLLLCSWSISCVRLVIFGPGVKSLNVLCWQHR